MREVVKSTNKNRIYLVAAFFVVSLLAYGENVVEIDLNSETLTATESLRVNYGDMELDVTDIRRDTTSNKAYLNNKFKARIYDPKGRVYFSAKKGEIGLDGKSGDFYNNFGYIEVSEITGAEYPNDKVYFGGDHVEYRGEEIAINDGWLTTDPKAKENEDYKEAGYALLASNILIEPDKQITLKGIKLNKENLNFTSLPFPWYRVNIRDNSEIPLFPTYSTSNEFGTEVSMGVLFGNRYSKFKSGIAPKYSEKLGLSIGNLEGNYASENFGDFDLKLKDALVFKKENSLDRRYNLNFSHTYKDENNSSEINFINSTVNLLDSYKNIANIYGAKDSFKDLGVNPLKFSDTLSFYTVESSFKLDDKSTFTANIKDLRNTEAYNLLVYDELKSKNSEDHDLFNQFNLKRVDGDTTYLSYYSNLKDMSTGNMSSDSKSHEEIFGVVAENKVKQSKFSYQKEAGDKLRPLTYTERWSGLTPLAISTTGGSIGESLTEKKGTYALAAVPEFKVWNSEELSLLTEKYHLSDSLEGKVGVNLLNSEKELAVLNDPLRKSSISNNDKDSELNRFNHLLFDKKENLRVFGEISNSALSLQVGGGKKDRELKDREGFYSYNNLSLGEGYRTFNSSLNFLDYKLSFKEIDTTFGDYTLAFGNSFENFKSISGSEISSSNSDKNRINWYGEISQKLNLIDEDEKELNNTIKVTGNNYSSNNKELLSYTEEGVTVENTVLFRNADISNKYKFTYSLTNNSDDSSKNREYFGNSYFRENGDNSLELKYNLSNRYTRRNTLNESLKNLSVTTYGLGYKIMKHSFGFNGNRLEEFVNNPLVHNKAVDNSYEVVDENYLSYGYLLENSDRIGLGYTFGQDKRDNLTKNSKELEIKKNALGVTYYDFGEVIDNTYGIELGTNRYGGNSSRNMSTDTYNFSYTYLDKTKDDSFLKNYALRELDKKEEDITKEDLKNIEDLIAKRNSENSTSKLKFDFNSGWKKPVAFSGDYTRKITLNTYLETNKERESSLGFLDGVKKFTVTTGYSENRIGVGYTFTEDVKDMNNWSNSKEREHILSVNAKLGKPSQGYRVTAYTKVESDYNLGGKYLGSIGVELGKEMGYYEWALAFVREYNGKTKEHDYTAALQFTLLALPKIPIFGFGVQDINVGKKVSPIGSIFEGIEAEDAKVEN